MKSLVKKILPKPLSSYRSVIEIRDHSKGKKASMSRMDIRSSVKIAIIDDEKFKAHVNLKTYGYKIQELPDIKSLDDISDFDIVICDLMGVGQNFDKSIGGASIIKEIKDNYPTKYVIAYTGARSNTPEANAAKQFSDDFIKKDDDITKLVGKLDEAIDIASDPYERWLTTRQGLIDLEIDLRKVLELESAYVEAINSNDSKFSDIETILRKTDLGGHAKGIVQSLIASGIWSVVFAA